MKTYQLLLSLLLAALPVALAAPALADTGGTAAHILLIGGSLVITVPVSALTLTTSTGGSLSGPLGQVQVNDARGAGAGASWVVNVVSSVFTPAAGPVISANAVGYVAGAISQVGTATVTANNPVGLAAVIPAVTATGITGHNSASWNPTITLSLPTGAAPGAYTGSITHSVS